MKKSLAELINNAVDTGISRYCLYEAGYFETYIGQYGFNKEQTEEQILRMLRGGLLVENFASRKDGQWQQVITRAFMPRTCAQLHEYNKTINRDYRKVYACP